MVYSRFSFDRIISFRDHPKFEQHPHQVWLSREEGEGMRDDRGIGGRESVGEYERSTTNTHIVFLIQSWHDNQTLIQRRYKPQLLFCPLSLLLSNIIFNVVDQTCYLSALSYFPTWSPRLLHSSVTKVSPHYTLLQFTALHFNTPPFSHVFYLISKFSIFSRRLYPCTGYGDQLYRTPPVLRTIFMNVSPRLLCFRFPCYFIVFFFPPFVFLLRLFSSIFLWLKEKHHRTQKHLLSPSRFMVCPSTCPHP